MAKGWARIDSFVTGTTVIALGLFSLVGGMGDIAITMMVMQSIIVYYLWQPHVKAYFGKV